VSVVQTTRQRINYVYVNEAFSTSEHRASTHQSWWRWYLLQCTVLCIVYTLFFFTDLEIMGPANGRTLTVAQSAPPLIRYCPVTRTGIYKRKKCSFHSSIVFHCFIVDFFLRNFLFTHVDIAILTTKKYFSHRASSFVFMSHKAVYFVAVQLAANTANSFHNANSARPSGLAKCCYQLDLELSVPITSKLQIKLMAERRYGDSKTD